MATVAEKPQTKQASKVLAKIVALTQKKGQLKEVYDAAVAPLDKQLLELKGQLEGWAKQNPDAFGGQKTMKLDGCTFGSKLGAFSVVFPLELPEGVTIKGTLEDEYLRIVKAEMPTAIIEKVDSKKVANNWGDNPKLVSRLGKLGITAEAADNFFVTPKK
jgi:hypothetical protein